ncbi:RagB/SusD family nutrient uptake outer membrane protein [Maribellus comscasis]|uniref:RagB/SusD family nutrient uptake outer membrane protein n=1 Tax=Maribellus comscasis TaxID=2681766 RepID=A0A6I6JVD5_9BACT|nr:RagB/SusD family nutrient uptake outer membrane protein [Maribellus comscasis]QGY45080.1 RagB/SusD family nutrient uptake outer membrane protein [Maribellus comscasis]
MKKIKLFILALGIIALSSCSESFLDSEPLTSLTTGNFYETTEDAELAIVGCYDGLQILYSSGIAFPIISEVLSDNCYGATGNTDGYGYQVIDEFDISKSPGDVDLLNENWKVYYRAIYRCNLLLQNMDQIDWQGDTDGRNSIEAQARFIRAYTYFDMVRLWENVPLLTEPSSENIPQSSPAETYKVITEDLLFAAQNGTETVEPGRVNKWAAKALLARVYLFYTGYYGTSDLVGLVSQSDVLQGLEDIISTGNYSLIEEFKNLWPAASTYINEAGTALETTYAGKDNQETVFAIKYNITSDYDGNTDGNHWLVMFGLRSQAFSPYGRGWGACTVLPKLYNAYEDTDLRKEASVIAIEEEGLDFDNSDQREYTGYSVKKYTPLSNPDGKDLAEANGSGSFMIGQFQDYVVLRYADVLLMAAELGSTNAQQYFDTVRSRAGLENKSVSKDNIIKERRFEFAFEGIRYWDLLRHGVETAANTIAISDVVYNGGVESTKTINKDKIIATGGFQMIPQTQVSLSDGVLIQNNGWN